MIRVAVVAESARLCAALRLELDPLMVPLVKPTVSESVSI
jgi:hypothetical protein